MLQADTYTLVRCLTTYRAHHESRYTGATGTRLQYESSKRRKLEGAHQRSFDAIDAVKPYKGGNDSLWALHRLNNIEKHRLLLTVGSHADGVHLGQAVAPHLDLPPEVVNAIRSMDLFLRPADRGFPLKAGYELYIGAPDEAPNPELQFRFDVALSEPGVLESTSLVGEVRRLVDAVEGVVADLTQLLG